MIFALDLLMNVVDNTSPQGTLLVDEDNVVSIGLGGAVV